MAASEIDWFTTQLPPVIEQELRGPADYYGAGNLIAAGMGLRWHPPSSGYWVHGWHYAPHNAKLLSEGCEHDTRMLVASERDAEILRADGFEDVAAVGLPFAYTSVPRVQRRPNSLLIMPPHVTEAGTRDWNEDQYIDQCLELRDQFDTVVACVSQQCVAKGYWVHAFDSAKIPWIAGAGVTDANALNRIRCLMSQFEFMTTNTIGSHVLYAAYCGCRISLFGEVMVTTAKDLENEPLYMHHPDLVDFVNERDTERSLREHYSQLFCHPKESRTRTDWAKAEIGEQYRLPFHLLAEKLGWGNRYKLRIKQWLNTVGLRELQ